MTRIGLLVLSLSFPACATVCPTGWAVRSGMEHDAYLQAWTPSVDVELSGAIGNECLDEREGSR